MIYSTKVIPAINKLFSCGDDDDDDGNDDNNNNNNFRLNYQENRTVEGFMAISKKL